MAIPRRLEPNEVICKQCDGTGVIYWRHGWNQSKRCPVCKGRGYTRIEQQNAGK